MLIFISKPTEITKIPDIPENSGISGRRNVRKKVISGFFSGNSGYFGLEPSRNSSERSKKITVQNFRMIGPVVPEKQRGGGNVPPPE